MRRLMLILALGLLAHAGPAAADAETGWRAYLAGDYETALAELRPAAEAGDAAAQYRLGTMFAQGQSVERDHRRAAAWYRRAAEQGHPEAQFSLGFLLSEGAGEGAGALAPRPREAVRWLTPAAERGDPAAQHLLARHYAGGRGVEADRAAALRWADAAARQGHRGGQYLAGVLLARQGTAGALIEAYKWFALAAEEGHPGAALNREAVAGRLNARELEKAKAAVRAFAERQ